MKLKSLTDTYTLSNGVEIPCIGFGTWQTPDGEVAVSSVLSALRLDTAISTRHRVMETRKALA